MNRHYFSRVTMTGLLAAAAATGLSLAAMAQPSTIILAPNAPPAPRVETMPPPPPNAPSVSWQGGHWAWSGATWVWADGRYVQRPQPQAVWEAGHWEQQSGGAYAWVDGHWQG